MATGPVEWDINTELDPAFWEEIGHTRLDFPAAVCELVDNAVSATVPGAGGSCRFNVLVKLVRRSVSPSDLLVIVADDGVGIDRDTLTKKVFSLGARSSKGGLCYPRLREHGFGLKHAIAWLVRARPSKDFSLVTAFQPSVNAPVEYYQFTGQLQPKMKLKKAERLDWIALAPPVLKATGGRRQTGTRVAVTTFFETAQLGWEARKAQIQAEAIPDLHALAALLSEELGVRYRHFLDVSAGRAIRISVADEICGDSLSRPKTTTVDSRPIPYLHSVFGFKGKAVGPLRVTYRRGISNPDIVDPPAAGRQGAFRIYYGYSMRGQGLDVSLNGRVVESPYYPWPDRVNNINNGLVGELEVEGDVETILTKDGIDWTYSPVMQAVKEAVLDADVVGPRGGQRSLESFVQTLTYGIPKLVLKRAGPELRALLESARTLGSPAHITPRAQRRAAKRFVYYSSLDEAARVAILKPGVELALGIAVSSRDTWGVAGVPVFPADFVFDYGGRVFIVECKDRPTKADDLYQVRRYWEGLVARGIFPTAGLIVSDSTAPEVKALADYFEKARYCDEKGNPIKIRFLGWRQFDIPSRVKGGTPMFGPNIAKTLRTLTRVLATV